MESRILTTALEIKHGLDKNLIEMSIKWGINEQPGAVKRDQSFRLSPFLVTMIQ